MTVVSSDPEPVLWPHPTTEGPGGVILPHAREADNHRRVVDGANEDRRAELHRTTGKPTVQN